MPLREGIRRNLPEFWAKVDLELAAGIAHRQLEGLQVCPRQMLNVFGLE